jgi:TonB family protein
VVAVSVLLQSSARGQAVPGEKTTRANGVEILSDTQGVDFGPYIKQITRLIYNKWLTFIPQEARPPQNMQAETLIRFSIGPTGKLLSMHLDGSTQKEKFDRAAWGAITNVGQYPPLPEAFTGPYLELRLHFTVNVPPKAKTGEHVE